MLALCCCTSVGFQNLPLPRDDTCLLFCPGAREFWRFQVVCPARLLSQFSPMGLAPQPVLKGDVQSSRQISVEWEVGRRTA